jgi:hypothetical protein
MSQVATQDRSDPVRAARTPESAPPAETPARRGLGAWILLFGSLSLGAGHGVLLAFALGQAELLADPGRLGRVNVLVVGWFVACVPLAFFSVLARKRLMRWARLGTAALVVALITACAFAVYVASFVRG